MANVRCPRNTRKTCSPRTYGSHGQLRAGDLGALPSVRLAVSAGSSH
jgi:hypothetical protein